MTTQPLRPLILVRGFGGPDISDEQGSPYQGFNDGTVYPERRGDNYIYEGFVLRAMKSEAYRYRDATNVVGYYASDVAAPADTGGLPEHAVAGTVVLDPATEARVLGSGTTGTIWIFRYYDLHPRALRRYGDGLRRLVDLIELSAGTHGETFDGVDVVAHSMGGLVVREGLVSMDRAGQDPRQRVHRIVTLGTPHRGISFQRAPGWLLRALPKVEEAQDELASFDPTSTRFLQWRDCYDLGRVLTVVGTDYRSYGVAVASLANRLSTLLDEGTLAHNRSDGLVKQASAQLPGAPRTFVHKCHGGRNSLVTSREAYEIAMRFFHGTHKVSLGLDRALVKRGGDVFGKSEYYLGVSIKPRYVDFDLFHQSAEAENCYGPFSREDLTDDVPDLAEELAKPLAEFGDRTTGWAGPDRLLWEGWVDVAAAPGAASGMVFRLDVYVGERDSFGIGFSDNVIFRKQYYVQVFPADEHGGLEIYLHTGERHLAGPQVLDRFSAGAVAGDRATSPVQRARGGQDGRWTFDVAGTGFEGTFRIGVAPA